MDNLRMFEEYHPTARQLTRAFRGKYIENTDGVVLTFSVFELDDTAWSRLEAWANHAGWDYETVGDEFVIKSRSD